MQIIPGSLWRTEPRLRPTVDASNRVRRRFASAAETNEVMNWPQTTPASTTAFALVKFA
jgi:hypothetical protein